METLEDKFLQLLLEENALFKWNRLGSKFRSTEKWLEFLDVNPPTSWIEGAFNWERSRVVRDDQHESYTFWNHINWKWIAILRHCREELIH